MRGKGSMTAAVIQGKTLPREKSANKQVTLYCTILHSSFSCGILTASLRAKAHECKGYRRKAALLYAQLSLIED